MHRASKAGKKRSFNRYWLRLNINPLLANMTHRALPDAYVTADFRELLKLASVDDLIMWSQQPILLPRCVLRQTQGAHGLSCPSTTSIGSSRSRI